MSRRQLLKGTLQGLEIRSGNYKCQKGDESEGNKEAQQGQIVGLPSFENELSETYTQEMIQQTFMAIKPLVRNEYQAGLRDLTPC
jgi:hypothetical protein